MKKYEVIKGYWAGKPYVVGETFFAHPTDVAHLVGTRIKVFQKPKPNKAAD